jgi:hypothetical protein
MYNIMEGKDPEEVKMEDLKDEEDHPPKKWITNAMISLMYVIWPMLILQLNKN